MKEKASLGQTLQVTAAEAEGAEGVSCLPDGGEYSIFLTCVVNPGGTLHSFHKTEHS